MILSKLAISLCCLLATSVALPLDSTTSLPGNSPTCATQVVESLLNAPVVLPPCTLSMVCGGSRDAVRQYLKDNRISIGEEILESTLNKCTSEKSGVPIALVDDSLGVSNKTYSRSNTKNQRSSTSSGGSSSGYFHPESKGKFPGNALRTH